MTDPQNNAKARPMARFLTLKEPFFGPGVLAGLGGGLLMALGAALIVATFAYITFH